MLGFVTSRANARTGMGLDRGFRSHFGCVWIAQIFATFNLSPIYSFVNLGASVDRMKLMLTLQNVKAPRNSHLPKVAAYVQSEGGVAQALFPGEIGPRLARHFKGVTNGDLVEILGVSRAESVPNLTRRFDAGCRPIDESKSNWNDLSMSTNCHRSRANKHETRSDPFDPRISARTPFEEVSINRSSRRLAMRQGRIPGRLDNGVRSRTVNRHVWQGVLKLFEPWTEHLSSVERKPREFGQPRKMCQAGVGDLRNT